MRSSLLPCASTWALAAALTFTMGACSSEAHGASSASDAACDLDTFDATVTLPPENCPNDLPGLDDCSTALPSYQVQIAGVIRDRCAGCHAAARRPRYVFDTYPDVFAARAHMLVQVYACRMPPSCAPPLDASERAALLKWLVCGAPDN